jgi:hypothetical protein
MEKSSPTGKRGSGLRHAFAIDPAGPVEVSDTDRVVIDLVCREVVRRRLTMPALLALEMYRPFNYLSAQAMHFFEPIVSVVVDAEGYRAFSRFLEQRGSVDHLIGRIESMGDEAKEPAADSGRKPE